MRTADLVFLGALVLPFLLIAGAMFRMRGRRGLFATLTALLPLPFVVGIAGWLVRELSRQPWIIQGVLRVDEVTSDQSSRAVLASLVLLVGLMVTLAVLDWWVLGRLARAGINRLVLGAEPGDVLRDDGASDDVLLRFGAVPVGGLGAAGSPGAPGDDSEADR